MELQLNTDQHSLCARHCHTREKKHPLNWSTTVAKQTLDYGWPQMTDPAVLKQYIFQKGLMTQSARQKREDKAAQSTLQVSLALIYTLIQNALH